MVSLAKSYGIIAVVNVKTANESSVKIGSAVPNRRRGKHFNKLI